jgi:DNA modification methylase
MGSGTTAVACKQLNRKFIGFEISKEYCNIAEERLKHTNVITPLSYFFEVTSNE